MLPDILCDDLSIVFCGTAVGNKSAKSKAYYAGPGNQFWPTLFRIGITPRQLHPSEYASLREYGVGLTDLVKSKSGSDTSLRGQDFDVPSFSSKIQKYSPKVLCFNGKKAAQVFLGNKSVPYGPLSKTIGATRLFVAPSTSGAARGFWDESLWFDLCSYSGVSR